MQQKKKMGMKASPGSKLPSARLSVRVLGLLLPLGVSAQVHGVDWRAKYQPCIDYYAVGQTTCTPRASTPVQAPAPRPGVGGANARPTVQVSGSAVDKYLENYGKPPREFVEFYLNPTQDNALAWVKTYQSMLQRGETLAQAWNQAEQLYQQGSVASPADAPRAVSSLAGSAAQAQPPVAVVPQSSVAGLLLNNNGKNAESIGAFAASAGEGVAQIGGIAEPVQVSYYFSATCPFCARLTPELAEIKKIMKSELKLTCIDVTPLGAKTRPDPANILGKLECDWRVPQGEEVADQRIQQTPTLVIRRGGAAPLRLSGYVPPVQLASYLKGEKR